MAGSLQKRAVVVDVAERRGLDKRLGRAVAVHQHVPILAAGFLIWVLFKVGEQIVLEHCIVAAPRPPRFQLQRMPRGVVLCPHVNVRLDRLLEVENVDLARGAPQAVRQRILAEGE